MTGAEDELINNMKLENSIIIYGAAKRAEAVIDLIRYSGVEAKLFVAVSDTGGKLNFCRDLPIQDIHELTTLVDDSIVLIAARPKFHEEMEITATELGFRRIIRIDEDINGRMYICKETTKIEQFVREQTRQTNLQYKATNLMRLNHLRDKVNRGKKVKIMFLLTSVAKFSFGSVYRAMEKNNLFDVSIFMFDEYFNDNVFMSGLDEMQKFYVKLKCDGYNVIWGYDKENNPLPLEKFSPDIVFYNAPYLLNRSADQLIYRIICNYLSCYIPYGIEISNEFEYHFEDRNILPAWIQFVSTRQAYDMCANITGGLNTVLSGHPVFDDYPRWSAENIPEKIRNRNKTVIYAPHWSVATWHNTSTFHLQYRFFLGLLKKYPQINFVFKPHPRLGPELRVRNAKGDRGIPSFEEYQQYCKSWEESPNGSVVLDSSYIDLFQASDCLITDCYSFIASWLPTKKPCFFLTNPQGPDDPFKYYYDFVHPIINSYYICGSEKEIEDALQRVIIDGNDEKVAERIKQEKEFIYNLGQVGEFISDYIERQLRD